MSGAGGKRKGGRAGVPGPGKTRSRPDPAPAASATSSGAKSAEGAMSAPEQAAPGSASGAPPAAALRHGPPPRPFFLARQSYRRRRMMDASRLLPLLGLFLFLLPILWRPAETPLADTAPAAVYLFGSWAGLIAAAFLLARALAPALAEGEDGGDGGAGSG